MPPDFLPLFFFLFIHFHISTPGIRSDLRVSTAPDSSGEGSGSQVGTFFFLFFKQVQRASLCNRGRKVKTLTFVTSWLSPGSEGRVQDERRLPGETEAWTLVSLCHGLALLPVLPSSLWGPRFLISKMRMSVLTRVAGPRHAPPQAGTHPGTFMFMGLHVFPCRLQNAS